MGNYLILFLRENEGRTLEDRRNLCRQSGRELAAFETNEEWESIKKLFMQNSKRIGLWSLLSSVDGVMVNGQWDRWKWQTDGSPIDINNPAWSTSRRPRP